MKNKNEHIEKLANALVPEEYRDNKFFSVMFFEREGTDWICLGKRRFNDGMDALNFYSNIPCPASQLIDAKTIEELETKEEQMITNFANEEWLKECLYPFM